MNNTTRKQFEELAQQLRAALPTSHVDEYPSAYHHEIRVTHKLSSSIFLNFTWREGGITVQEHTPHLPPHQAKRLLAVNLPSITLNYLLNTSKKHLYAQN